MKENECITVRRARSVFMTVHFNDKEFNYSDELRQKFAEIKEIGINAVRFDFRINEWKEQGRKYVEKTQEMIGIAVEYKLGIIPIISNPVNNILPNKEEIEEIRRVVTIDGTLTIPRVQLLNEWNNRIYTPKETLEDLPRFITEVREVFGVETQLYATLFLGTTFNRMVNRFIGIVPFDSFVEKFSDLISKVDILGIDYYPGTWHLTFGESLNLKRLTSALTLVTQKFPNLKIDLGELGVASFIPCRIGEIRQAWIFTSFMRLLVVNKILDKFEIDTVGLYISESPTSGEAVPNIMNFGLLYTADRRATELYNFERRQKLRISIVRLVAEFLVTGKITLSNDEITNRKRRNETLIVSIIKRVKAPPRKLLVRRSL